MVKDINKKECCKNCLESRESTSILNPYGRTIYYCGNETCPCHSPAEETKHNGLYASECKKCLGNKPCNDCFAKSSPAEVSKKKCYCACHDKVWKKKEHGTMEWCAFNCKDFVPAELNLASQEDWRKRLMDKFCVMFERAERESIEGNHYWKSEDWVALLEDFIENLLSLARTEEREKLADQYKNDLPYPMGVSQWRNHGKKYGYDKYFIEQAVAEYKAELVEKIKGAKRNCKLQENGYYSHCGFAGVVVGDYHDCEKEDEIINDIINLISPNKE